MPRFLLLCGTLHIYPTLWRRNSKSNCADTQQQAKCLASSRQPLESHHACHVLERQPALSSVRLRLFSARCALDFALSVLFRPSCSDRDME